MADTNTENAVIDPTKALSVDATDINVQNSNNTEEPNLNKLSSLANEVHEQEAQPPAGRTTTDAPQEEQKSQPKTTENKENTEYKDLKQEEKQPALSKPAAVSALSDQYTMFESDEAKQYQISGTFRDHWEEFCSQPFVTAKVMTLEGKEEVINFANPLAPRRIYLALKIKRISDIDNVSETYRCRFHMYFDWLLTEDSYHSYCQYRKNSKNANKKLEWCPKFVPRYDFLNIVEAHGKDGLEKVDYGIEGPYRVQRIKDFAKDIVGFDPEHAFMCRMRLEVDATFCEELELENFPVDCQDFSVVMRESWGSKHAIFVPELRTKKGKPSAFARVDPSFSVLDEWEFHNSRVEFRSSSSSESRGGAEYFLVTIRFKMRRRYSVYLWNIVLYMFFITLMSLSCFALGEADIVGERMGLAVTLLLTAVAFQDIVFEELPNVAYLTLLHKYIIISFMFISGVSLQTACTAIQTVPWFHEDSLFDYPISFYAFVAVFVLYNLIFMLQAGWLRHWESKKLYMDSEQLEEHVELAKHQFKMKWFEKPTPNNFVGINGRIASFVDIDPLLEMENFEADNFFSFIVQWICMGIGACLMCRCVKCEKRSETRRKQNTQRGEALSMEMKEVAAELKLDNK